MRRHPRAYVLVVPSNIREKRVGMRNVYILETKSLRK